MKHLKSFQIFEAKIDKLYDIGIFDMEYDVEDEIGIRRSDFENCRLNDVFVKSVTGSTLEFENNLEIELSDGATISIICEFDDGPVSNDTFDHVTLEYKKDNQFKKAEIDAKYYMEELLDKWAGLVFMVMIHVAFYNNVNLYYDNGVIGDADFDKTKLHLS